MSDQVIFVGMVFILGFLLMQSFVAPLVTGSRGTKRRLRERIKHLGSDQAAEAHLSLVRERYLEELSPLEKRLESLPGMDRLRLLGEQAGSATPAYRRLLHCALSALLGGVLGMFLFGAGAAALLIAVIALFAPILWLRRKRDKRLRDFDEQLPDALTVMSRSLRAGLPFSEGLSLVSREMKDPAGHEFGLVFAEINYGGDTRSALLSLLQRVPSVSAMAMVTSVLIQRETGGNLAEILDKLGAVMRERFHFQRKVRTLSAEGRTGAWVLVMLPFGMAGAMSFISPEFLPMMTQDPLGRKLVLGAFLLMVVGILWLRRIVRIDV